ncbi:extracellular solute-binding protein [Propioniciclava soli]|uniref:ABC transporter substrate-binding protein n=1 Tax=Propioniciclava soli TaxID=2775081 RepID=UPI001E44AB68|nr:extracellular solute-binding protein [Propioniciclava soli]
MRTRLFTGVAATAVAALALTACSGGGTAGTTPATTAGSGTSGEQITLTVATFNEFGYTDEMFAEYEADHPGITIDHQRAGQSTEAHENLMTRLAAGGSGIADIQAVDGDWLAELKPLSDQFVDLSSPDVEGRWLDWVEAQATTEDGALMGYATDIGPEATCYRRDLFEAAGLPSDREEVATLLDGDWDHYFEVGRQFKAATPDVGWFDSAGAVMNARVQQLPNPYSSTTGEETIIPLGENTQIKELYDSTLAAAVDDDLSAGLGQWGTDWINAFQSGAFATMQCPSWMLGVIEGNAAGQTNWDVASTFPGGGGNWGGSYLTVPAAGAHTAEAQELAAWLTAPEQQLKAFAEAGTFPSQVEAQESSELAAATNEFFNNAPTGEIFTERAEAVESQPFKGEHYFAMNTIVGEAIGRVDVDGTATAEESWNQAVSDADANIG